MGEVLEPFHSRRTTRRLNPANKEVEKKCMNSGSLTCERHSV